MSWTPHLYLPKLSGLTAKDRQDWEKQYSSLLIGKDKSITGKDKEEIYLNTLFKNQYSLEPWYKDFILLPSEKKIEIRNQLLSLPVKDLKALEYAQIHGLPVEEVMAQSPEWRSAFVDKVDLTNDLRKKYGNTSEWQQIADMEEENQRKLFDTSFKNPAELQQDKYNARIELEKQLKQRDKFNLQHKLLQEYVKAGKAPGLELSLSYTDKNGKLKLYSDAASIALILDFYNKYGKDNDELSPWYTPDNTSKLKDRKIQLPAGTKYEDNQKILLELLDKDLEDKANSELGRLLTEQFRLEYNAYDENTLRGLLKKSLDKGTREYLDLDGNTLKYESPGSPYYRAYATTPSLGEKAETKAESIAGWALTGFGPGQTVGSTEVGLYTALPFAAWGTLNVLGQSIWGNEYFIDQMKKEEMVDLLSKTQALKQLYGETVGLASADKDIKEFVTENQIFFDKNVNIGKGIFVGGVANMANKAMAAEASILSWYNKQKAANFLKGKDEEGNDLPFWNNPVYWNEVDLAGSFRESDINVFHETGGLSKYQNLYNVENGWKLNLDHALMMNKFLWSDLVTMRLAGYMTKGVAAAVGKGIEKINGVNPVKYVKIVNGKPELTKWWDLEAFLGQETSALTRFLALGAPAFASNWFNVGGISQAYGMQTFTNIQTEAEKQIDEYILGAARADAEKEFYSEEILNKIDLKTNEEIQKIKLATRMPDGLYSSVIMPDAIRELIANTAMAALMDKYKELHKNDPEVKKIQKLSDLASLAAYKADVLLEQIAMSVLNFYSPRKMLMNKSFRAGFQADPASQLKIVLKDGKFVIEGGKAALWKNIGKSFASGFESNFHDDVRVDLATGIGLDLLNDTTNDDFDLENKLFLWGDIVGSIGHGIGYAKGHYFDKLHWLDGWIGGLGSAIQIAPNLRALSSEGRAELAEIIQNPNHTLGDLVGHFIYSPAYAEYKLLKLADEAMLIEAAAVNQAIEDNKATVENVQSIINRIRTSSNRVGNITKRQQLDDGEDLALLYVLALDALTINPEINKHTSQLDWVNASKEKFRHLAEDEISASEKRTLIDLYLVEEGNEAEKAKYDAADTEQKLIIENKIISTIQKSALGIQKMFNRLEEVREVFLQTEGAEKLSELSRRLFYTHAIKLDSTKERQSLLEEKLSGSSENNSGYISAALYSTVEGYKATLKLAKIDISREQKKIDKTNKQLEKTKKEWESKLESGEIITAEDKENHIRKVSSLLLKLESLERRKIEAQKIYDRTIADEASLSANSERVLTKEQIMLLSPEQRLRMFAAPNLYSEAQQKVINEILAEKQGTDFFADIYDSYILSERVKRTLEALDIMKTNPDAVNMYINATVNANLSNAVNAARRYSIKAIELSIIDVVRNKASYYRQTGNYITNNQIKELILNLVESNLLLQDYAKKHKEDKQLVKDILDKRILLRDIRNAIAEVNTNSQELKALLQIVLLHVLSTSTSKEDIILKFQNYANLNDISEEERKMYEDVLDKLSEIEDLKNAVTIIEQQLQEEEQQEEEQQQQELQQEETIDEENHTEEIQEQEDVIVLGLTEELELEELEEELTSEEVVAPNGKIEDVVAEHIEISTDEGRASTPDVTAYAAVGSSLFAVQTVAETTEDESNQLENAIREAVFLFGNVMREYDTNALKSAVTSSEIKRESKADDSLSQFNKFLEVRGIKYQDIIDYELGKIYSKNSKVKIQFLTLRPDNVAGKDKLHNFVFNVIEYTPEVKKIHVKERGGVIQVKGKEYLIVGTLGYTLKNAEQLLPEFFKIKDLLQNEANAFFASNSGEIAYVSDNMYTHIRNITTGYIVKAAIGDTSIDSRRSIHEMLGDSLRDPNNIRDIDSLGWGIQTRKNFLTWPSNLKVYAPHNIELNLGSSFVLVPNGKGAYTPVKLKAIFYKKTKNGDLEIKPGRLADSIYDALVRVSNENYNIRALAITELVQRLYMPKEGGPTILIGTKNNNTITVINRAGVKYSFTLDLNFDRQAFIDTVQNAGFRINITPGVISNTELLEWYDEAGALDTDAAKLGTSGVDYSVYPIGIEGKPIVPEKDINKKKGTASTQLSEYNYSISFLGITYRQIGNTWQDEDHHIIDLSTKKGEALIRHLECNKWLETNYIPKAAQYKNTGLYIIDMDKNIVWQRNEMNKEIYQLDAKRAEKFITEYKESLKQKEREANAKRDLENQKNIEKAETSVQENTQQSQQEEITEQQIEDQSLGVFEESTQEELKDSIKEVPKAAEKVKNINDATTITLKDLDISKKSVTFADVLSTPENLEKLLNACEKNNIALDENIMLTLRDRGFPVDAEFDSIEDLINNIDCY